MHGLADFPDKIKGAGAASPSRRHNPATAEIKFCRLVDRVHRLGPKPLSELLKELVGTDDGLQADTLFLLEKYGALDPEIVRALGADTFPPSIFPVGPT